MHYIYMYDTSTANTKSFSAFSSSFSFSAFSMLRACSNKRKSVSKRCPEMWKNPEADFTLPFFPQLCIYKYRYSNDIQENRIILCWSYLLDGLNRKCIQINPKRQGRTNWKTRGMTAYCRLQALDKWIIRYANHAPSILRCFFLN